MRNASRYFSNFEHAGLLLRAKLEIDAAYTVSSIAEAVFKRPPLIGVVNSEMPGMYHSKDFDLAGFAVGIAEKDEMNRLPHVKAGDILIALPSSGVHSNGFFSGT